jgi:transketolase
LGYIPVVDTFAQFGVTKGALPLIMASLSEAPMICVFSHTGFQDAADGASHQALSYLAMTSSLQHADVYCLTCSEEADALMTMAIEKFAADRKAGKHPVSTIFFLGRENFPKTYVAGAKYDLHRAQIISETSGSHSVTIVASGSLMPQALLAAEKLKASNVGAIVVNPNCHNKIDTATLRQALKKSEGRLVTVEDHQMIGGLGQMIAHALAVEGISFRLKSLAVQGEFGQSAYSAHDLYQKHHLDEKAIVQAARELL